MNTNVQRTAFEAFVRSGNSPVPPSEIERPLADGTYRTSAANAGWAFWQAATAKSIDRSLVAKWLVFSAPHVHEAFLNEFKE